MSSKTTPSMCFNTDLYIYAVMSLKQNTNEVQSPYTNTHKTEAYKGGWGDLEVIHKEQLVIKTNDNENY